MKHPLPLTEEGMMLMVLLLGVVNSRLPLHPTFSANTKLTYPKRLDDGRG
jgi:hypothetical protein